MKAIEIIRIIVFSLLGAALLFLVQPWIYQNRMIRISDPGIELEAWLPEQYFPGATIVFAVSVISTVVWYFMAAKAKVQGASDVERWRVVWWLFLLLPVVSICIALFLNKSNDARLSLTGFYIFDIIILFWLPTATSSPGSLMYLPPGGFLLRRLLGS